MSLLRKNWVTLLYLLLLIVVSSLQLNYALRTNLYFSQDDFGILGYASKNSYLTYILDYLRSGEIVVPRRTIGYLLGYLNFKLLYDLFSVNPLPYIINNHLIHTFNVLLLFFTIYKLTGRKFTSFFVSIIFNKYYLFYFINIHEYLVVFFCLLTILLFLYKPKNKLLSSLTFILALLSKQYALTLPFFLLYIAYFWKKNLKKNLWPFFVILGGYLFLQLIYYFKNSGSPINFSYETSFDIKTIYRNFTYYFDPKIFLIFILLPLVSKKLNSWWVLIICLLTLFPALILANRRDFYYLYLPAIYLLAYTALNLPKISLKAVLFSIIVIFLFGGRQAFPIIARQNYPNWQYVSIQNLLQKVREDLKTNPRTAQISLEQINLERDARSVLEYDTLNLFLEEPLGKSYKFTYDQKNRTIQAQKQD